MQGMQKSYFVSLSVVVAQYPDILYQIYVLVHFITGLESSSLSSPLSQTPTHTHTTFERMCFKLYVRYLFVQAAKILCFSTHTHRESKNLMFPPPFSLSLSCMLNFICALSICARHKNPMLSLNYCQFVTRYLGF